jgi:chromosome segregation ATPase
MKQLLIRSVLIITVLLIGVMKAEGQTAMPDVLLKNSLKEQLNFLDEHTKIYESYRAIREDMFQKLKSNVSDTMSGVKNKIAGLYLTRSLLTMKIDSLTKNLAATNTSLDEITKSKNSISVIGLEINKSSYNKVMWTILAILLAALVLGFLAFKRNMTVLSDTKKEFQDLKDEFEAYRKTSREAREKMTMAHFLELKKLKGE